MEKNRSKGLSRQQEVGKIIYNLLLFLVIALPIVAFPFVFEDVFDLPKVTVLKTVAFSILVLWLVSILYKRNVEWNRTPADVPLLSFAIVTIVATLFSFDVVNSLVGISFKRHEALPTWFAYFILFFAGSNFLKEQWRLRNLIRVIAAIAVVVSIYGIFQHFGYDLFSYKVAAIDRFRSFATFGNAVFMGAYLALIFPLILSLTFWERNLKLKTIWLAAVVLVFITLVFTYTRGAWLGGLAGFFLWLFLFLSKEKLLKNGRKRWISFLLLFLLLILVIAITTEKIFPIDISVKERILSAFELKGSVASRLSIWKSTLRQIFTRPWLGWGPETQRLVTPSFREEFFVKLEGANKIPDRPHNQLLNIAYSFGLFGVFSYLWLFIVYLWVSLKNFRRAESTDYLIGLGILAGSFGYLVQEQFAFSVVGVTPLLWLLMGANLSSFSRRDCARIYKIEIPSWFRNVLIGIVSLLFLVSMFFILRFVAADFYYYKGIKRNQMGDLLAATQYFSLAAKSNPWDTRYIFAYGEGAKNIGLRTNNLLWVERSISSYLTALERSPKDYDLLFGLGNAYFIRSFLRGERDYTEAKKAYIKAIEYEPYFAEAYAWLGKSYLAEGKLRLALKSLQKAIELSPKNVAALDALGRIYERKGDVPEALSYFRKILVIDPYYQPAIQAIKRLEETS